jgi:hypothetical protein
MLNRVNLVSAAKQLLLALCLLGASLSVSAEELKSIGFLQDWGIEPVHIRVTADGYMVEFRYRIMDVEKALILSDRKDFPRLQSQKSRAKLVVPYGPTVGFLKSNRKFVKLGKNYTTMFSNENRHMNVGDKVKIEIRDQVSPELVLR